jgi:tetratricopeptide (TPR) repeat protein
LALAYAQFEHDLGRYYQAVPTLQKSLELHTWAEQLYYPLGVALIETGDTAGALQRLTQATKIHERHTLGVEWDLPDENQSDTYAFLGTAQFLNHDAAGAAHSFMNSLMLDPHGVILVLHISQRIWNPNLRPVEINPPDDFLKALTKTRRDLLTLLRDCDASVLKLEVPTVQRNRTILQNLHACIETELKRRAEIQEKRVKMGFKDDPDEMEAIKK